ncbi:MAG TPA: DNA-binding protein [Firmicutes bacterium]|nr:DNA-binding protein [Bacillota bacterium]
MDSLEQANEWKKMAEMGLGSAEHLLNMHPTPMEVVCYHCQQSAEKYLKGYLVLHGNNPPRTHDLDELCKLCLDTHDGFGKIADQCSDLTAYGVQTRYPMGLTLEERDMSQALNGARQIRDCVLALAPELG